MNNETRESIMGLLHTGKIHSIGIQLKDGGFLNYQDPEIKEVKMNMEDMPQQNHSSINDFDQAGMGKTVTLSPLEQKWGTKENQAVIKERILNIVKSYGDYVSFELVTESKLQQMRREDARFCEASIYQGRVKILLNIESNRTDWDYVIDKGEQMLRERIQEHEEIVNNSLSLPKAVEQLLIGLNKVK